MNCCIASSEKATAPADEGVEAVESVGAVWSMFLILLFRRGPQFFQFRRGRVAPQTDGGRMNLEHFVRRRRFLLPSVRRERQGSGEEMRKSSNAFKNGLGSEMPLASTCIACIQWDAKGKDET